MAEHTPTPWSISDMNWEPWDGAIGIEGPRKADFEHDVICWTTSGDNEAANAAFIVKTVNSHQSLVDCLEMLDRRGGLGADIHAHIRGILAAVGDVGK